MPSSAAPSRVGPCIGAGAGILALSGVITMCVQPP